MTASSQEIRPGLSLYWGTGGVEAARLPGLPAASTIFAYSIAGDAGRMAVVHGGSLPLHPPSPAGTDSHVALAITGEIVAQILGDDRSSGAQRIRIILAGEDATMLELPLTAGARLAVESIRRCPFVGACRNMALAARCNDLLVEFVTALTTAEAPRSAPLTRSVHDRIVALARGLTLRLDESPSLSTLARQSGLSETSLKRGFRQVFETTVFGYLREKRMERARQLLQAGEATVLEAAAQVGYSNPSNFSAAFRRQFGVNPKSFQLTARRH